MNKAALLQVKHFSKTFVLHEQDKVIPSAQGVSLDVYPGSLTALIGPTGAGKSSVLKGIYRSYLPTAGEIQYHCRNGDWIDLAQADEHEILALRRDEIGFVTQFLHYLPRQTTENVVAQPLIQNGMEAEQARSQARQMLARLNLPERLWGISPATFSGGEKQRVNLARGLVSRPRLLLLDEPTASLDPDTAASVVRLIEEFKQEGVAMLAIFHQPDLVERLADSVVAIKAPAVTENALEEIA